MLLIPKMRNLEVLGVYKCPLIHVGHTLHLIDVVQMDKPKGRERQVSLDFFPSLHIGPIVIPGGNNYFGNFGVTWDSWQGDTCLALWALLCHILPIADELKIDMITPGTMFRKWLDMTPLVAIDETIEVLLDKEDKFPSIAKLVSMFDYMNYKGRPELLTRVVPNRPEGFKW
jgi:hypothetical protein